MPIASKLISISALAIATAFAWPTISGAQPVPSKTTSGTQSVPSKMKDCLLIEDGYKERLDCYDAVIAPEPKANAKKAKSVAECRFLREQDERLSCYNGFVDKKAPPAAEKPPAKQKMTPPPLK